MTTPNCTPNALQRIAAAEEAFANDVETPNWRRLYKDLQAKYVDECKFTAQLKREREGLRREVAELQTVVDAQAYYAARELGQVLG